MLKIWITVNSTFKMTQADDLLEIKDHIMQNEDLKKSLEAGIFLGFILNDH